ncbi:MAG: hypothetical protein SF187_24060 [Deltaproteobacteria bacterium]|nr:hypothetical protein [Deltaproteobacteria bacterium]
MSLLNSVKDTVLGQAMKLAGSPQVTRLMTDPRLMNAAMKAMSLGGTVKEKLDQCGKVAGGVFGLATQDEVSGLRGTIQNLEDQVAVLESRAAAAEAEAEAARAEADADAAKKAKAKAGKSAKADE